MRRIVIAAVCILAPVLLQAQFRTSYSDLSDSETVRSFKEDVGYLAAAALEGRAAGSEGEADAARYMASRFEEVGADLLYGQDGDLFGIMRPDGDTLRSHNVAACISGSTVI